MISKQAFPLLIALVLLLVQSSQGNAVSKDDQMTEIVQEAKTPGTQTFEIPSSNYEYPDDNYYFEPTGEKTESSKTADKTLKETPNKPAEKIGLRKDEVAVSKAPTDAQDEDDNAESDADDGTANNDEKSAVEETENDQTTDDGSENNDDKQTINADDQSQSLLESSLEKSKSGESPKANEDTTNPPKKSFMDRRILIALCSAAGAIVLVIIAIVAFKYYRYHKYKSVKQENPS